MGLQGDFYELEEGVDFTQWLEYFAEGVLDELRRVYKKMQLSVKPTERLEPHHKQILNYIE